VPDYRVYFVNDEGHFFKSETLECPDDAAAIESAKQFIDGHDLELWQRARKITILKAIRNVKDK
jgi:hypothetical protein